MPWRRFGAIFAVLSAHIGACTIGGSDAERPGNQPGVAGAAPDDLPLDEPLGDCEATVRRFDEPSATHLPECSDIEYEMSPPVYGDHYPVWAAYQTYDYPVPDGYLVHSLEHGAVVIAYDCPEGCEDEVAEVQAFITALPPDPRCADDVVRQVILAPKPNLGARWAASAWGYSVSATCFDADIFRQFYAERIARGPEDLCNQGKVISLDACP
jgi:hypothetical protein